jgi:hypothetical protein
LALAGVAAEARLVSLRALRQHGEELLMLLDGAVVSQVRLEHGRVANGFFDDADGAAETNEILDGIWRRMQAALDAVLPKIAVQLLCGQSAVVSPDLEGRPEKREETNPIVGQRGCVLCELV